MCHIPEQKMKNEKSRSKATKLNWLTEYPGRTHLYPERSDLWPRERPNWSWMKNEGWKENRSILKGVETEKDVLNIQTILLKNYRYNWWEQNDQLSAKKQKEWHLMWKNGSLCCTKWHGFVFLQSAEAQSGTGDGEFTTPVFTLKSGAFESEGVFFSGIHSSWALLASMFYLWTTEVKDRLHPLLETEIPFFIPNANQNRLIG